MFINNTLNIYLFLEIVIFLLALIPFILSIKIFQYWDFESTKESQYLLEKSSYLLFTVVIFILITKIMMLPLFIYLIDDLSTYLIGAMCGAGVIDANSYGMPLLGLKVFILYMATVWIIINRVDNLALDYPYMIKKTVIFISIFLFLALELILDLLYFFNIFEKDVLTCCSTIYGNIDIGLMAYFGLDKQSLLILFYLTYLLTIFSIKDKRIFLVALSNALFLIISFLAVTNFFSTYIYELPTHKCPFCLFQKEYYYIGYFIYSSLVAGTILGVSYSTLYLTIDKRVDKILKLSLLFNTIFVIICSFYVVRYYFINGVFL